MARADEQLINRRVYTDKGELLREGLVPLSIKNERAALMAFWAEQDRQDAEAEAAAAQAAVEELQAPVVPDAAELVAPLVNRLAAVEGRLDVVDQLAIATPEQVLAGTMAISRAAGAAALVEAATATTLVQLDGAVKAADERLAGIEGTVGQTAAAVGELLADVRASVETAEAQRDAKLATAISKRITQLEVQAAQLRGPKGERGRIGQGLIAGAGKRPEKRPDGSDWAPGDSWLDTKAEGFQLSYMDAGGKWSQPARLVPAPKLINSTVNTLDLAPRTLVSMPAGPSAGGGAGGGEKLRSRMAPVNGSVPLADSSNWRNTTQDPTAGQLFLEYTAADGSLQGRKGYAAISFVWEPSSDSFTEYALIGDISGSYTVQLNIQRSAATPAPAAVIGSLPSGATATQVFAQLVPVPGGGASDTTQFLLAGVVLWAFSAQGTGVPLSQPTETPLWQWI